MEEEESSEETASKLPTLDEIPSEEDMNTLKTDIATLRARLQEQKRVRSLLGDRIAGLEASHQLAQQAAKETLVGSNVLPSVQEAFTGTKGLVELQSQGRALARKMETLANERHRDSDDEDQENYNNRAMKQHPKSLKERYQGGKVEGESSLMKML